ncbi:MAG: asparagine synthase (glutamine-hydrolyzing) [Coriobacteriia bacterium]|nr:asparagine synthase (glutamine-hydrolyzing) [Coriobacteriia bacterium]
MCGICGFTNAKSNDMPMLKKMCDKMAHRGPDGEGQYIKDNIAFGHRRLSLIDLEHGDQPIVKDKYAIVLNGEIYNYKEIREELINKKHTFKTNSDTEVVLEGYIEWDKKVLHKLRGMFAFAIWNGEELFCARDFFGIKPLYYTMQKGQFIFASEIKVLLEHKNVNPEVNMQALEQYLCFQFSALKETFFKNIFVLPQGHYMTIKNGKAKIKRYWKPEFRPQDQKDPVKKIASAMEESVKYHNVADVEVGSLLSSGIDSSYNAALLKRFHPEMKTFTVGFDAYKGDEDEYKGERNEIAWAEELAEILEVENHSHTINEEEYWEALPKIAWHMDEPNGDPSAVALYFVDKLAAKYVKAVLSGEGADELFGGYTIYQTSLSSSKLKSIPKPLLSAGSKIFKALRLRGANYLDRASKGAKSWYYTNAYGSAFSVAEREKLLNKSNIAKPTEITKSTYEEVKDLDDCTQMQYTDLHFWILGDILLKGDKMSMAHSLECRVPFLDKEVFNVAKKLKVEDKISPNQTKIALREASKDAIPQAWAEKKKLGFPVPMVKWLREDKYYDKIKQAFNSETSNKYFNTDYLNEILDNHKNEVCDNSRKIWIVYMFLLWHEAYFSSL